MVKSIIFLLVLMYGGQTTLIAQDTPPGKAAAVYPSLRAKKYKILLNSRKIVVAEAIDSLKENTLYVSGKRGPQQISVEMIKQLLVAKKKRPAARGLAFGALSGAASGSLIGLAAYRKPEPGGGWDFDFGPGFNAAGGGVFGLVAGSLVGTIIGASSYRYIHHDFSNVPTVEKAASLGRILSGKQ
jgi:hypothetical protein